MKPILFISLLLLMTISVTAQDRDRDRLQLNEYLLYQDGTLLHIRDRDRVQLKDPFKLLSGSTVNTDGTYTNQNGVRKQLQNGECLDLDGNRYLTQQQLQNMQPQREQAMNQLHYAYQNGKVLRLHNQEQVQLRERITLQNGTQLNPDGTYKLRDQAQMRLRDGECFDPDGNIYSSRSQFRTHSQLRAEALSQDHFVFRDSKLYRFHGGVQSQIDTEQEINGITVWPDGNFQFRNGEQYQLRSGECLDPQGNIYASQMDYRFNMQTRLQARNQEHFIMKDGQLYKVMNQEQLRLRERQVMANGLQLNPDGTYQMGNQAQARLRDGECLDYLGNKYDDQNQLIEQRTTRFQAMAENHFFFQNDKMYRCQDQVCTQIGEGWKFKNGATVKPNGLYQLRSGKRIQLRDGECLDQEGKRYDNRDRFRERMELRIRDRMEMRDRNRMDRRNMLEPRRKMSN